MTRSVPEITLDDIEALAVGAWILGTGGGGSPYLGLLNMRRLYAEGHRVGLMSPFDLADDDRVAVVSNMGAPLVGQERLADSRNIARAVEIQEGLLGAEIPRRHVARNRRRQRHPAIDGGGASRTAGGRRRHDGPRLSRGADDQRRGRRAAPLSLRALRSARHRGGRHQGPELEMDGAREPQDLRRDGLDRLDLQSAAHRAPRSRSGASISPCRRRSASAAGCDEAQRRHEDPVAAILDEAHGKLLFRGKVVDVARRTTEGFLRGRAVIEGLDEDRGTRLEIAFQNEWVVAWRDGVPLAMSPDLICVLDTVSGEACGTETIRYGRRVTVVALPAPPVFLTPKGLEHVGPRAFGYDLDFRSVFDN